MENSGETLKYLTVDDILEIAEEQVGRYQLLNENQLHYLVQIVGEKIGDTELFPTLAQKAAVYALTLSRDIYSWTGISVQACTARSCSLS